MSTKQALLDSAENAARRRGYDGFSYADLAHDVGIRKASIHHHFPTKADLVLALLERYRERFVQTLADIARRHTNGAERLAAYLTLYRDSLAGGEMVCLCVAFSAGRDSLSEPILAELNRFHDQSLSWLDELFTSASEDGSVQAVQTPSSEAASCLALVEGAQLLARASRSVTAFDAATATLSSRLVVEPTG